MQRESGITLVQILIVLAIVAVAIFIFAHLVVTTK